MTKKELVEIFQKLDISYAEGIQHIDDNNQSERIVFWDYVWESLIASGQEYNTLVTYQISFFALDSRNYKLIGLRKALEKLNLHPTIYHEYNKETREFHSYFSLEIMENIDV